MTMFLLALASTSDASHYHTAPAALEHLTTRYLPEWEKLFLHEGGDEEQADAP